MRFFYVLLLGYIIGTLFGPAGLIMLCLVAHVLRTLRLSRIVKATTDFLQDGRKLAVEVVQYLREYTRDDAQSQELLQWMVERELICRWKDSADETWYLIAPDIKSGPRDGKPTKWRFLRLPKHPKPTEL